MPTRTRRPTTGPATPTPPPTAPPAHVDPCSRAADPFPALTTLDPPQLISEERVRGAGVLMLAHLYGTRLHVFDAVDRARRMFDDDDLCLGAGTLRERLYCWPERGHRVERPARARLAARVLGIAGDDVPDDARDPVVQRLLGRLLDAVHDVCDPGPLRTGPTPAAQQQLDSAAFAVRSHLSATMTGLTSMRVRDLHAQLEDALGILEDLSGVLPVPCRPGGPAGGGGGPDVWGSLSVLVGDRLRADGVEIVEEAETATHWRTVFEFLDGSATGRTGLDPLCRAAAALRPSGRPCGSGCAR